jgi:thiamine kinase-like enzyme
LFYINDFFSKYKIKQWVLSHNDLHLGNFVLFNHNWFLIDFEYVSLNDVWFDVASFISESIFNQPKLITRWLKIFKATENEQNIINYWIFYQNILFAAWSNYLFEVTQKPIYWEIMSRKLISIIKYHYFKIKLLY